MKKKFLGFILIINLLLIGVKSYAGLQEAEEYLQGVNGWREEKLFIDSTLITNKNKIDKLKKLKELSFKRIEEYRGKGGRNNTTIANVYEYLYYKIIYILNDSGNNGGLALSGGEEMLTSGVKIAIMGDQNEANSPTLESFQLVKNEKAELIIHNGDFLNNGDAWDKIVTKALGPDFPVIAVMGNHDIDWEGVSNSWGKFQQIIARRTNANKYLKCVGEIGKKSVCSYKGIKIVSVSPGINSGDHAGYIRNALANDKSIWRICHWHKTMPEMQLGPKSSRDVGRGVFEEVRKAGCIVTIGHDHSYGRTYLLDNMAKQHVIGKKSPYLIKPGQTIHLLVGSSGMGLYGANSDYADLPHWAVKYTQDDGLKGKGVLFCTFNGRNANCYFKSVTGKITDRFTLKSGN